MFVVAIPLDLVMTLACCWGFFSIWIGFLSVFIPEKLAIGITVSVIFFGVIFLICSVGALAISALIEPQSYWEVIKLNLNFDMTLNYFGRPGAPAWHMLFQPIVFALDIIRNLIVCLPHLFNGAFLCWYVVGIIISLPFVNTWAQNR